MNVTLKTVSIFPNGQVNQKCPIHNTCYLIKLLIISNSKELHQVEYVMEGLLRKDIVIRRALVSIFYRFIYLLQGEILLIVSLTILLDQDKCNAPYVEVASTQFTCCSFLFVCIAEQPLQLLKIYTLFLLWRQKLMAHKISVVLALSFDLAILENPKCTKFVIQDFYLHLFYLTYVTALAESSENTSYQIISFVINIFVTGFVSYTLNCSVT